MNYEVLTDEILLKLVSISDDNAFQVIYKRYFEYTFLLACKKVRSMEVAKDIVQQIFLSIWERRQSNKIDNLKSYLNTAVKFRVISYLESKYSKAASLATEQVSQLADRSTEESLLQEELRMAIYRAMEMLPPKTRQVFQLSRFQSRTNREIASSMNISEKAVEYHVAQSLKIMRKELSDYLKPLLVAQTSL